MRGKSGLHLDVRVENWYLVLSVGSLDGMLVAEAYACATGRLRSWLTRYALVNFCLYLVIVLAGSLILIKFLISFELFILVCAPNLVIFLVLNGWRYHQPKPCMDRVLLFTWAWLIFTIGAYFLYYMAGFGQAL